MTGSSNSFPERGHFKLSGPVASSPLASSYMYIHKKTHIDASLIPYNKFTQAGEARGTRLFYTFFTSAYVFFIACSWVHLRAFSMYTGLLLWYSSARTLKGEGHQLTGRAEYTSEQVLYTSEFVITRVVPIERVIRFR